MRAWLKGEEKTYKNEFADYMLKYKPKTAAPRKVRLYLSALERMPDLHRPADLQRAYHDLGDHHIKAFRNFVHFLYDFKEMDVICGYPKERWLDQARAKPVQAAPVRDYTAAEIQAAYAHCPEGLKPFFKFLVYSGGRATQCKYVLDHFDPENLHGSRYDESVSYYDAAGASSGTKNVFVLFMPTAFAEELAGYRLPVSHIDSVYRSLNCGRVTAKSIRKYTANLLADTGADLETVDFVQGRQPRSVVSRHYLDMTKRGTAAYAQIIGTLPV